MSLKLGVLEQNISKNELLQMQTMLQDIANGLRLVINHLNACSFEEILIASTEKRNAIISRFGSKRRLRLKRRIKEEEETLRSLACFSHERSFGGHTNTIVDIDWSPDGESLFSIGQDGFLCKYVLDKEEPAFRQQRHANLMTKVCCSCDGMMLATCSVDRTVRIWNAANGAMISTIATEAQGLNDLAWSPQENRLCAVSEDGLVSVWEVGLNGKHRRLLELRVYEAARSVAFSRCGQFVFIGGSHGSFMLVEVATEQLARRIPAHGNAINAICCSRDKSLLATASTDATIKVWNATTWKEVACLEGFTRPATAVSFTNDSKFLAACSGSELLRMWAAEDWRVVTSLESIVQTEWNRVKFCMQENRLALTHSGQRKFSVLSFDFDRLGNTQSNQSIEYSNAKVVLVGETGVGKTKLGHRLVEDAWEQSDKSTHGMKVWTLHSQHDRDILLWDFAGQQEYRLIHQIFLTQASVALVLYDPGRSSNELTGVEYWENSLDRQLDKAIKRILVAARIDVGRVPFTDTRVKQICLQRGYASHFACSSYTGEGCDNLKQAIIEAIDWDAIPRISSPEVFKEIKEFIANEKSNCILSDVDSLLARFNVSTGSFSTVAQFEAVLGHIENAGIVKRLSFGRLVLLAPEFLNGLASDIIDHARLDPLGLGCVAREKVLTGRIHVSERNEVTQNELKQLLHATAEELLRAGIAFEQDGQIVFPAKFNEETTSFDGLDVDFSEIEFSGPVESIYATLVVKLNYGGVFEKDRLRKNYARFRGKFGCYCGIRVSTHSDGKGKFTIFGERTGSEADKLLFFSVVRAHLEIKNTNYLVQNIVRCRHCNSIATDREAVNRAIKIGVTEFPCQYCFKSFPLETISDLARDRCSEREVHAIDLRATEQANTEGDHVSALAELQTTSFAEWLGGADELVFVWIHSKNSETVKSSLGLDVWRSIRRTFSEFSQRSIADRSGYLLKEIGDDIVAVFKSATIAAEFAMQLHNIIGIEALELQSGIAEGDPADQLNAYEEARRRAFTETADSGSVTVIGNSLFELLTDGVWGEIFAWDAMQNGYFRGRLERKFVTGELETGMGGVARRIVIRGEFLDGGQVIETKSDDNGNFLLHWQRDRSIERIRINDRFYASQVRNGDHLSLLISPKPDKRRSNRNRGRGKR